jgi:hypothetical protein
MTDLGFRNIWISLAVVMVPVGVLMALVRFSDDVREAILVATFVLTMIVFKTLDHRELRRRGIV